MRALRGNGKKECFRGGTRWALRPPSVRDKKNVEKNDVVEGCTGFFVAGERKKRMVERDRNGQGGSHD